MEVDLLEVNSDNFCNDSEASFHDAEIKVTLDSGVELDVNVDVDLKFDLHFDEDCGFKSSVVSEVYCLFNAAYTPEGDEVLLTTQEIIDIEDEVKYLL